MGRVPARRTCARRWGLLEPPGPWLPESALAEASVVLVPRLAVDRRGVRLGRGRGFYDRSLARRDPQARLIAVVRDAEFVDELPARAARRTHDARDHAAARGCHVAMRGMIELTWRF